MNVVEGVFGGDAHWYVIGDHDDLGFKVDAPGLIGHRDVVARADKRIGAALVHERVGPESRGHLSTAGFAHQFDVIHVG